MPFIRPEDMKTGEPLPGWRGRFWRSQNMSFAHYDAKSGSSIHEHHHPNEEVWIVIDGELEVTADGETQIVGPGAVAVVSPNVTHSVRVVGDARAIVANYPLRESVGSAETR